MNLAAYIVDLRRRICPKTSYVSSGKAGSVLFTLLGKDDRCKFDSDIAQHIMTLDEFEAIEYIYNSEDLRNILSGAVLIVYMKNFHESQRVVQHLLLSGKWKLIIHINDVSNVDSSDKKRFLEENKDSISFLSQIIDSNDVLSCFLPRKVVKTSLDTTVAFNKQPSVQSMTQFRFLWSRALPHSAGYDLGKQRVLQRLADRSLFGTDKKLSQSQWDELIQRALDAGQNDFDIYSLVREKTLGTTLSADLELVLPDGSASAPSSGKESNNQEKGSSEEGGDGRAMHMVNMTVECIPASLRDGGIAAVLDYGCAEGAITAELGRKLKLPADKVFGADVRSIPSVGFTFMPLQAEDGTTQPQLGSILPALRDGSVDLVTTAMVLHHVTHVSAILLELRRVISNKGVLVLREHHCVSPDGGAFLDITHGLYSLSWSSPIEWPDFLSEYKAFYRSREEWNALAAAAGFTLLTRTSNEATRHYNAAESSVMRPNGKIPNVIKAYYAVYAPDPRFVFPATATQQKTQPVGAAARRDLAASEVDVGRDAKRPRTETTAAASSATTPAVYAASPELFESKKYPGRFYRIDPATGATVWV